MWPWGHVAVAYLIYTAFARKQYDRLPRGLPVIALVVGSQFPDLIDKPLGWSLGVLPGGRTLGHSIFFAVLLILAVYLIALRYDRIESATAFALGHVSHLVADLPPSVLTGDFRGTTFLFWPVLEQPDYESVGGILEGFLRYSMGPYEWVQLGLFFIAVIVWYRDGKPGIEYVHLGIERLKLSSG